jgi:hypothetical protein
MQPLFLSFQSNFPYQTKSSETSVVDKIQEVTKKALLCFAAIAFFATTATFFTIGFFIGISKSKKVQKNIHKINLIWQTQPREILLITAVGAFLSLPIVWAAASFLTGAHLGSKLYYNAKGSCCTIHH